LFFSNTKKKPFWLHIASWNCWPTFFINNKRWGNCTKQYCTSSVENFELLTFPDFAEFSGSQLVGQLDLCSADFQLFERNLRGLPWTNRHQIVTYSIGFLYNKSTKVSK